MTMSAGLDIDSLVVKYSCPIGKEGCPGPIVTREGNNTFLVCHKVTEKKTVFPQETKQCGNELLALLFALFMTSGKKQ
jgi:hypothetical protein